jgi:photosystem II stability/assembly factor-like uncharacterized protein
MPTTCPHRRIAAFILATAVASCPLPAQNTQSGRQEPFKDFQLRPFIARSIGPAMMGGRVSAMAFDPADPYTFYVGLGTGGVMKTSDNGVTFSGIFENEAVAAIGAIAVAPSKAAQVWVGTGEANDRNSSSWGDGVYRSDDGGGSWKNMGLKASRTIARIAVHPTDTNTVWVAAMGDLWNKGGERGLFKTTDGGKTWKVSLKAPSSYDEIAGCGDVAVDPKNPDNVYAALYARVRTPWSFTSGEALTGGKPVGGIYRSTDGGASWKKLGDGLPAATGRIGLSIYPANPAIIFAVIQSEEGGSSGDVVSKTGGIFRTGDAGATWTRVNPLNPRPFYFSQIRVDPSDSSKVYVLGFGLHVSLDGGKTFREDYFKKVHPDLHDLQIDPRNTKRLILGTDGGAYQSYTGGKGWDHLNRMAAGEFYRVTLDNAQPYRIAGGLQDNLNWVGPSATRSSDGIVNSDWSQIGGGDGFYCVFDPRDPNIVYAESQQGYVYRLDLRSGQFKGLRPEPVEGQQAFRFHWNTPFIPSLHDTGAMYLGGNRVFRLTDRGERWEAISPDLSARDPEKIMSVGSGAENYGVVYALCESPLKRGMLWAGTDDGKLWVTRDSGKTWADLTKNLPGEARNQWISRIEAGHHSADDACVAVDAHRTGNFSPLVYRTSDGGKSWSKISGGLPTGEPAKVVREGLSNRDLLFVGTEFHLYFSLDRGKSWSKIGGLPTVAVDDIVIHPRDRDLVIATHGRSIYIIDDIRPLEEFHDSVKAKARNFIKPRNAEGFELLPGTSDWGGVGRFSGANPPTGAILNYWIREYNGDGVSFSVKNPAGETVASVSGPGSAGFNRVTWDLKMSADLLSSYGGEGQKFVAPGEYTITFSYGKVSQSRTIRLTMAPGLETR